MTNLVLLERFPKFPFKTLWIWPYLKDEDAESFVGKFLAFSIIEETLVYNIDEDFDVVIEDIKYERGVEDPSVIFISGGPNDSVRIVIDSHRLCVFKERTTVTEEDFFSSAGCFEEDQEESILVDNTQDRNPDKDST